MQKEISTGHVFRVVWRGWAVAVTAICLPIALIGGSTATVSVGNWQVESGRWLLVLLLTPLIALVQGLLVGGIVCLGYIIMPQAWISGQAPNKSLKKDTGDAGAS